VADQGINVLAYCSYSDHTGARVQMVADDTAKAKRALEQAGYDCRVNSVVLVGAKDTVGAAAHIGAHLGMAGVDILYSYASSAGDGRFVAVFKTANDDKAIQALENCPIAHST
jgi:hypothetical protein